MKTVTKTPIIGLVGLQKVLLVAGAMMMSSPVFAAAEKPVAFLGKIQGFFCELLSANGPLVPLISAGAIAIFAIGMMLSEEKGGLITTLLKIGFGIAILVGIPAILGYFGVGFNCAGGGSSNGFNIQL